MRKIIIVICLLFGAATVHAQMFTLKQSISDLREGIQIFGEYCGEGESTVVWGDLVLKEGIFKTYSQTNYTDNFSENRIHFNYAVSSDVKKEFLLIYVYDENFKMFCDLNFDGILDFYGEVPCYDSQYAFFYKKKNDLQKYQKDFEKYVDIGAHG